MKILRKAALVSALLAFTASPASATQYGCTWRVEQVGVDWGGYLTMRFVGGPSGNASFYVCNTNTGASGGITAENCRGWMSVLIAAASLGRQVAMGFDTSHANNTDLTGCDATTANFGWKVRVPTGVSLQPS